MTRSPPRCLPRRPVAAFLSFTRLSKQPGGLAESSRRSKRSVDLRKEARYFFGTQKGYQNLASLQDAQIKMVRCSGGLRTTGYYLSALQAEEIEQKICQTNRVVYFVG